MSHAVLSEVFQKFPPKHKILVDIGAYGAPISNTIGLLSEGWRGILIEANPDRHEAIKKEFEGKNVEVLQLGVTDVEGEMEYHLHSEPLHNSFNPDWYPPSKIGKSIMVKTRPIANILRERNIPVDFDLLAVDTEGFDKKIVAAMFTSEYRPRVIITERTSYAVIPENKAEADAFYLANGYKFYWESGNPTYGDLIYLRADVG